MKHRNAKTRFKNLEKKIVYWWEIFFAIFICFGIVGVLVFLPFDIGSLLFLLVWGLVGSYVGFGHRLKRGTKGK